MKEIIYVERSCETRDGKTTLTERRYHGVLEADGSFRLLGCCGKRLPLAGERPKPKELPQKSQNRAA